MRFRAAYDVGDSFLAMLCPGVTGQACTRLKSRRLDAILQAFPPSGIYSIREVLNEVVEEHLTANHGHSAAD